MNENNKPADDYRKNFGMMIPTSPTPIKKYPKYFGWSCIRMKWVGIRCYKRIVPVRSDKVFDFLFWKFVKPIKQKPGTITYITNRKIKP
jgi:hypothetical protein